MTTFVRRLYRAALLDRRVYEEVEADRGLGAQAVAAVILSSAAGGIGLRSLGIQDQAIGVGVAAALVGWVAWAMLIYLIGTHMLPEPETHADAGELLRTLGFASAPGLVRVFGIVPFVGPAMYGLASLWMLLAMVVAVRQALDYRSTVRAVAVCTVGWTLSLVIAAIIGIAFAPSVS